MKAKNEAAELLQQFSGTPRFGKRRLHLRASLTERPPKRKIYFLNFCRRLNVRKKKLHAFLRTVGFEGGLLADPFRTLTGNGFLGQLVPQLYLKLGAI